MKKGYYAWPLAVNSNEKGIGALAGAFLSPGSILTVTVYHICILSIFSLLFSHSYSLLHQI